MGVRPDGPSGDFTTGVLNKCGKIHPATDSRYRECLEYEAVVEWAEGLYESYTSRASMNEWFIYFAGTVALASLASIAGIAASGHGGSDAVKIIPIVGGFTSGFFGLLDNKSKAEAYINAAKEIRAALGDANTAIKDPIDSRNYGPARAALYNRIAKATNTLEEQRYTLAAAAAERRKEVEKLQGEIVNTKIDSAETQKLNVAGGSNVKEGEIVTLTVSKILLTDFKWPDDFKILVGSQEAKLISRSSDSVTFASPKNSPGVYAVDLKLKERSVPTAQPKAMMLAYPKPQS
jgi:hypothetical protein